MKRAWDDDVPSGAARPRAAQPAIFLAICADRPGQPMRDLLKLPNDIAALRTLLELRGYRSRSLPRNPSAEQLRAAFARRIAQAGEADVVVYFGGHGTHVNGEHFLVLAGFDRDNPGATGLRARDLVEIALQRSPRPRRLLLILDACQAGGAINRSLVDAMLASGTDVFVLAATGQGPIYDGAFRRAFVGAIHDLESAGHASLPLSRVTEAVNRRLIGASALHTGVGKRTFDMLDIKNGVRRRGS